MLEALKQAIKEPLVLRSYAKELPLDRDLNTLERLGWENLTLPTVLMVLPTILKKNRGKGKPITVRLSTVPTVPTVLCILLRGIWRKWSYERKPRH